MATSRQESAPPERGKLKLDKNTVIKAQAGDEAAFENLWCTYYPNIAIFLIHLTGNDETGRDLTQETFIRAWTSLKQLDKPDAFIGWLYRIARNGYIDHLRKPKPPYPEYLTQEHASIHDKDCMGPEAQVIATDQIRCALAAISREEFRVALVLYHIQGMSHAYIAELLELKESTIKTYISNGMKELHAYLLQAEPTFTKERNQ